MHYYVYHSFFLIFFKTSHMRGKEKATEIIYSRRRIDRCSPYHHGSYGGAAIGYITVDMTDSAVVRASA